MRDDGIWRGDQCIAPDDPRNFGPEWERISGWLNTQISVVNKRYKQPVWVKGDREGIITRMQAMEMFHIANTEAFYEIMRRGNVVAYETLGQRSWWREDEVSAAVRFHSCDGCLFVTLERAALHFAMPLEELERCILFCDIHCKPHTQYDIADLRYAVSQSTWIKNRG